MHLSRPAESRAAHRAYLYTVKLRKRRSLSGFLASRPTLQASAAPALFAERYHDPTLEFGSCGKINHGTRSAAKRHAKSLRKVDTRERAELVSEYWCDRCRAWHVGHSAKQKVRGRGVEIAN